MGFITPEDSRILKKVADKIAERFHGRVGPETTFGFTEENITRYVEVWTGAYPVTVGVHLVADDPEHGDLVVTYWWGHKHKAPGESDRIDCPPGRYAPDGSESRAMLKDIRQDLKRFLGWAKSWEGAGVVR